MEMKNARTIQERQEREIVHFQYKEWPDHGYPENTHYFRKLLHKVDKLNKREGPIIIHCSAGIGRTGTFCTVHKTLAKILPQYYARGKVSCNILQTILDLRKERAGMVQTKEQYMFCYLSVLEELESIWTAKPLSESF